MTCSTKRGKGCRAEPKKQKETKRERHFHVAVLQETKRNLHYYLILLVVIKRFGKSSLRT